MNHREMIRSVISTYPAAETHGFRRNVMLAVRDYAELIDGDDFDQEEDGIYLESSLDLIPDAHIIDAPEKYIICFECEDSHPVKMGKAKKYADLWLCLDAFGWDIGLVRVSPFGTSAIDGAELARRFL